MPVALILLLGLLWSVANAAEWRWTLAAEARHFASAAVDPRQHGSNLSVSARAEFFHDFDGNRQRLAGAPFLRLDRGDSERSHFDLRELYWRYSFSSIDIYAGLRTVFWGVTEALHLVDIINQTDLVENPDTEDKLGQPMVQLSLVQPWGTWEVFVLPFFRERLFPGVTGRLRTPIAVDTDLAGFESSQGKRHNDFAVRYTHSVGPVEFGVAHFAGTGRDPLLTATQQSSLAPFYQQIDQTSLDLAAVTGSWLWKMEALSRREQDGRFTAVTGGFEVTLVGLGDSAIDLGLIAEYQYDQRGSPQAAFQDDLALGARLAFNNAPGTQLLLLGVIDRDGGGQAISIEGRRRLGNNWSLTLEGRWFSSSRPDDPLFFLRRDDYLQLELAWFF